MRTKIAACVHVFYEDGWNQIAQCLTHLPEDADIFVTCREEIAASLTATVHARFANAEVITMPNIGMDVLPFLLLSHQKRLSEYEAVLKLHTKNTKSKLRTDQGRIMLEGLCGSTKLVGDIINTFRTDKDTGMIGTAFQLRSANALMYGNRARMKGLLEQLEITLTDWPFFTGTMFWIAGRALHVIERLAPELLEQARSEVQGQTGGDGTLAHTLERVFGALCKSAATEFYLTERADAAGDDFLVIPLRLHGPANQRRFVEAESTDLLRRYVEAAHWCSTIRVTPLFDNAYYTKVSQPVAVPGMTPAYHFVLYGDMFGLNPGHAFDSVFYQLSRRDVVREKICSLAHYLHIGRTDGTPAVPNDDDWFELGQNLGLFNSDWYNAKNPDVALSGMTPQEHYRFVGQRLGRAGSPKFAPAHIPGLARDPDARGAPLRTFLKRYFLDEEHLYKMLRQAGRNGDYELVRMCSARFLAQYGTSRTLNEALATSYILDHQWEKGKERWLAFYDEVQRGEDTRRHGSSGISVDSPSGPLEGFHTIKPEDFSGTLTAPVAGPNTRICVYTTLFGDIDALVPVFNKPEGVDFICFTDHPREAAGWQQVIVESEQTDNNLKAKVFKVLPHKHLQKYTHSLFLDANTVFLGRTHELLRLCLSGGDFVMWQHPMRDDAYTEINAIIAHRRHEPVGVIDQISHYAKMGLPSNTGMFEASFIWRKHGAPSVVTLMEQWWDEIMRFSKRDQISLSYLVWKTKQRPHLLSPTLGTSRDNIFFFKASHRNGREHKSADAKGGPEAPWVVGKKRDITFLYSEEHIQTGSTVLRGQQLSGLVKTHYGPERAVHYSSDTDVSDQIIILSKGFLKTTTPEQLEILGKRNLLIADFVDEPPRSALINEIDVLMASSQLGYKSYLSDFPDVPAFHVTHHVDIRIPHRENTVTDRFRAGYFGELVNTVQSPEIGEMVSFNLVDTSKQTHSWIDELAHYNFHYAYRRTRGIDGAKPFLKGFVAAQCGANIMIQNTAGDASFYLGSDYPYLMPEDATSDEIAQTLRKIRDDMGGAEWRYGHEIMRDVAARSSVAYVVNEFGEMINGL